MDCCVRIYSAVILLFMLVCARMQATPTNDNFINSVALTGTSVTYVGDFTGATLESNEPVSGAANTVWVSWAAPATGSVMTTLTHPPEVSWAVYTGPSVDHLQSVRVAPLFMNSLGRFWVVEGAVYHFQFSGSASGFEFNFEFQERAACTNDNFSDAQTVRGGSVNFGPISVEGTTMELGEPAHNGTITQRSLWWKWQAPQHGNYYLNPASSLATNVTLAVYSGSSVEALTFIKKATDKSLTFPVTGGRTYYFAGAGPSNWVGDILGYIQHSTIDRNSRSVPGNVLQEPSWEGTGILDAQYWHWSGSLGGHVNESFPGADGITWPSLANGTKVWQDFSTVPGHRYTLCFAFIAGGAQIKVSWDTNELGISTIPVTESSFWHWDTYTTTASNTASRITLENLGPNVGMDAFSVVDLTDPPTIVTQPSSVSAVGGGTAAFTVGVTGSAPLNYQWYFNNAPLVVQTNHNLVLGSLSPNQTGDYFVVVTNGFGSVTSSVAPLFVDAPTYPTIVWQPYGDTVAVGGYYSFNVTAIGDPPLTYQWFANGAFLTGATNKTLTFTDVQTTNAGTYQVAANNPAGTAWSLPAILTVSETAIGGGTIDFRNKFVTSVTNMAPVFDLDGISPLNGNNYVAQLYAGSSLDLLRPAGQPTPFQTGFNAGYFVPQLVTLANVAAGSNCVVQVRAWEAGKGNSFEEARALGGKFGKSGILTVSTGGEALPPQYLVGLQSFGLQAGLPYFQVGTIEFVEKQPPATFLWAVHGQAGSLYLIEKSRRAEETVWRPFTVVTNVTGTVTFTDTADSAASVVWYRARILD